MMDFSSLLPTGLPADPALLPTLLDLLPMGVMYYTPVLDATGALTDLALAYLNPAAQRMTGMPAQPGTTYRQQFPTTDENGAWDFHRRTWLSGEPQQFQFYYDADGFDSYFRVASQRLSEGLLTIFTDTQDEVRSQAELALLASQARERAARAEAEHQQAELRAVFEQAPVAISLLQGPTHVIEFANTRMAQLWGHSLAQVVGQPHFTALPYLADQGFEAVLDTVWRTGEPHYLQEQLVTLHHAEQPYQGYFNITYQPSFNGQGQRTGIITSAIEVTDQVRARQQTEQLNQELEVRVQERTQAAEQALALAEHQRQQLQQVLLQLPMPLLLLRGATHVVELVNAQCQRLFPQRQLAGVPMRASMPELEGQGFFEALDQVYQTGETIQLSETESWADFGDTGQLQRRYYTSWFLPFRDVQGQITGVLNPGFDVTEQVLARRQVEQLNAELEVRVQQRTEQVEAARAEVENERALLQALLTQAPIAIGLYTGQDLRVVAASNLFATQVGRPHAQVVGRPLLESAPELHGQGFDDLLRQVMATQVPFVGTELQAVNQRDGEQYTGYYNSAYEPLYGGDSQVIGVLSVSVEVTEQVLARQQVEQLNQELESRVQARTRQLEEQQALLGRILGQVPAAVATLEGPEHRYSFFNAQYHQLSHEQAALGRAVAEVSPEAATQGFIAVLDGVYQTGEPFVGNELFVELWHADGSSAGHYLNFVYQPLRDLAGQVNGILVFAVEVTAAVHVRQQNEALQAELLASAQRQVQERETFYQIFEQTPALVALLRGTDHSYEYANPAYQALFPGRQLVGLDVIAAVPELQDQGFTPLLDHVYQTGEAYFGQEVPFVRQLAPGQPPRTDYFNFTYQAYRENGQVAGISIFAFDVTGQALAHQERENQRRELTTLFEQAPAGVCILDGPELVYTFSNPAYRQILPGRELLGRSVLDVLPELRGTEVETLLRQVYATGEPYRTQEHCIPLASADGRGELENRYFTLVYQARRDDHHRITGVLNLVVEVTEQVLARQQAQTLNDQLTTTNEELHASNTQLTRTNVDLDNFIYTASHDLKAPITNIEGLLLALEHELPAVGRVGDVPQMLIMMQDAVDRFRRTIAHLTDLSRLQKEHSPDTDAVALAPVVEAVRLDLTPLLLQTQGQLTVTIPAGLTVLFAEKNLRSVVYNLLSNALKYHHPDRLPEVHLRSWLTDDNTVLEVQDNGLGLDLAQGQERLFAMFQRLHTHVEGTGIGLYMVKRILENAGGRIEVSSELGQGTTFQVYFRR